MALALSGAMARAMGGVDTEVNRRGEATLRDCSRSPAALGLDFRCTADTVAWVREDGALPGLTDHRAPYPVYAATDLTGRTVTVTGHRPARMAGKGGSLVEVILADGHPVGDPLWSLLGRWGVALVVLLGAGVLLVMSRVFHFKQWQRRAGVIP